MTRRRHSKEAVLGHGNPLSNINANSPQNICRLSSKEQVEIEVIRSQHSREELDRCRNYLKNENTSAAGSFDRFQSSVTAVSSDYSTSTDTLIVKPVTKLDQVAENCFDNLHFKSNTTKHESVFKYSESKPGSQKYILDK